MNRHAPSLSGYVEMVCTKDGHLQTFARSMVRRGRATGNCDGPAGAYPRPGKQHLGKFVRVSAFFFLLSVLPLLAQPLPSELLLPVATETSVSTPQTYPQVVSWNPQSNAQSFTLTVNSNVFITTGTVVSNVPAWVGTNSIRLTASNASGMSAPTLATYLLAINREVTVKRWSAPSPLGTKTILATESITNPVADKFYGHTVTLTNRMEGRLQ